MTDSWHSYPKIYALGHAAVKELLFDEVIVEEKVDGSQFSFGRFNGELKIRSKGVQMFVDAPEAMFQRAVDVVKELDLVDGWTYRAEYLQKPHHNTIAYDRIPTRHLMILDINTGQEEYLGYTEKIHQAAYLGLECVPCLYQGKIEDPSSIVALLDTISVLGGQKVEGIVIKNYSRFGMDKKVLMGKYVSEAFKETNGVEWKKNNPTQTDIIQQLIVTYKTTARWDKAIQHLRDAGKLTESPKDIGNLIKEVQKDVEEEEKEQIKQMLYNHVIGHVRRGIVGGLPEYYKEYLMKKQFQE